MNARTERRIVACTLIACALTCALPAAAAAEEGGTPADKNNLYAGLTGRPLSDEEMGNTRGRYVPPGSTVIVQNRERGQHVYDLFPKGSRNAGLRDRNHDWEHNGDRVRVHRREQLNGLHTSVCSHSETALARLAGCAILSRMRR